MIDPQQAGFHSTFVSSIPFVPCHGCLSRNRSDSSHWYKFEGRFWQILEKQVFLFPLTRANTNLLTSFRTPCCRSLPGCPRSSCRTCLRCRSGVKNVDLPKGHPHRLRAFPNRKLQSQTTFVQGSNARNDDPWTRPFLRRVFSLHVCGNTHTAPISQPRNSKKFEFQPVDVADLHT